MKLIVVWLCLLVLTLSQAVYTNSTVHVYLERVGTTKCWSCVPGDSQASRFPSHCRSCGNLLKLIKT